MAVPYDDAYRINQKIFQRQLSGHFRLATDVENDKPTSNNLLERLIAKLSSYPCKHPLVGNDHMTFNRSNQHSHQPKNVGSYFWCSSIKVNSKLFWKRKNYKWK